MKRLLSLGVVLLAMFASVSCAGSSPTAPSKCASVCVESVALSPTDVARSGDTITVTVKGFKCPGGHKAGVQYVRDDEQVLPPASGYPCAPYGNDGDYRVTLNPHNSLLSFAQGHTITAEIVVMETYPLPIYRHPVGSVRVE